MSITSNSRPPGCQVSLFHNATTPLFFCGIEQDQRAIALDPAAVADDAVPGIIVASPAVAVPGGADALEELAQPRPLGRGLHIGRMDRVEHLPVEDVGHLAHLRFHPQRHVLDVAVDSAGRRDLVISVDSSATAACRRCAAGPSLRSTWRPAIETLPLVIPIGLNR